MAQFLKQVSTSSNGFIKRKTNFFGTDVDLFDGESKTYLSGSSLNFTLVDRTDLTTTPFANLFATFKMPVLDAAVFNNGYPYASKDLYDSTFGGSPSVATSLSGLNQNQIIVIDIPKNEYGEIIIGGSIDLTIPVAGNDIRLRGVYFDTNDATLAAYDKPLQNGGYVSETRSYSHAHASTVKSSSDDSIESNVVYLFCDDVQPPVRGGSWNTGNTFTPIGYEDNTTIPRQTALPVPNTSFNADVAVGVAYLDKGFIVLTHPDIVNFFDFDSGPPYTNVTAGNAILSYKSLVTEYVQKITCNADINEFFDTANPTYTNTMRNNGDPVYITEIGLYNEDGKLIAIAKPSQPIPKDKNSVISFSVEIKL